MELLFHSGNVANTQSTTLPSDVNTLMISLCQRSDKSLYDTDQEVSFPSDGYLFTYRIISRRRNVRANAQMFSVWALMCLCRLHNMAKYVGNLNYLGRKKLQCINQLMPFMSDKIKV